jgi:hypothetical protein
MLPTSSCGEMSFAAFDTWGSGTSLDRSDPDRYLLLTTARTAGTSIKCAMSVVHSTTRPWDAALQQPSTSLGWGRQCGNSTARLGAGRTLAIPRSPCRSTVVMTVCCPRSRSAWTPAHPATPSPTGRAPAIAASPSADSGLLRRLPRSFCVPCRRPLNLRRWRRRCANSSL